MTQNLLQWSNIKKTMNGVLLNIQKGFHLESGGNKHMRLHEEALRDFAPFVQIKKREKILTEEYYF